mmetsp:Transcript_51592/g.122764  ORF Transcript_51592/g.122764 Transcript_51592/m.122764 type:complete len:104 (+) Transcript_51592:99-410(+)
MFFLSPVLLRSKSKRLTVQLLSSAQTGFFYFTEKSPLKKEFRMALRKYDPVVNRHVMFYETPLPKNTNRMRRKRSRLWARWTGNNIQELVKIVARKFEKTGQF